MKTIGLRIKHHRKLMGLTLKQLSGRSGVSIGLISELENDKVNINPTIKTLRSIAKVLQVSSSEITEQTMKTPKDHGDTSEHFWRVSCMDISGRWWVFTSGGWQLDTPLLDGHIEPFDRLSASEKLTRVLNIQWVFGVRMDPYDRIINVNTQPPISNDFVSKNCEQFTQQNETK
jgi:transcriptional regulator with XRE-family HTH domain